MKLKFLPLLLLTVLSFVACSDDDDNTPVRPVQTEKQFVGSELDLTMSGSKVLGKKVIFTPDENDITAATLTFQGENFNLEEAMNKKSMRAEAAAAGFKTSSVFAGEPEVVLPIKMTVNGDKGAFEGNGESKYYTFKYNGTVLNNSLSIELSDVVLKNNKLAGTAWNLEPIVKNDWGMVESIPVKFEWESEKKLEIEMFGQKTEYSMSQIMALVMSIGVVPVNDSTKITIPEVLASMLQGVQFDNDGNIAASYIDMNTKQPATSPKGLAQYVVVDDSKMKLILNPYAIAANASTENKTDSTSQMSEIMKGLAPMILQTLDADTKLSEGIDINYTSDADKLYVNVDQNLFLPLLKMVAPMLQNPQLITTIVEAVKKNPDMAAMAPMLESVLKQFPEVINTTTKIEVGLKFVKK